MVKRRVFGKELEELDQIRKAGSGNSSLDEENITSAVASAPLATQPLPTSNQFNSDERVSNLDTVQKPKRYPQGFTQVPHNILRSASLFKESLDFMIYLQLFTYSFGFNRKTASMSQAQLEEFTGVTKNTVKRSLDRLETQGFIRRFSEYQVGRVSRSWTVFLPAERTPSGKSSDGSNLDSIQNGQCPDLTVNGSNPDTVTLSKIDTYIDIKNKENLNKSLSQREIEISDSKIEKEFEALERYFVELKPEAKKRSERVHFQCLLRDYSREEIALGLEFLQKSGTPGSGAPCHSPMAYLSKAMEQLSKILAKARQNQGLALKKGRIQEEVHNKKIADETAEILRQEILESAFNRALEYDESNKEYLERAAVCFPLLDPHGTFIRNLAMRDWSTSQPPSHYTS